MRMKCGVLCRFTVCLNNLHETQDIHAHFELAGTFAIQSKLLAQIIGLHGKQTRHLPHNPGLTPGTEAIHNLWPNP
jgi:hypothetical protein